MPIRVHLFTPRTLRLQAEQKKNKDRGQLAYFAKTKQCIRQVAFCILVVDDMAGHYFKALRTHVPSFTSLLLLVCVGVGG